MPEELVVIPQDLSIISAAELSELETRAVAEFDSLHGVEDYTPESIERMSTLTSGIDRIRAETAARASKAAVEAEAAKFTAEQQRIALGRRVHGDAGEGSTGEGSPSAHSATVDTEAIAAAATRGATAALVQMFGDRLNTSRTRASLADAQRHAPAPNLPAEQLSVTASVDIPGVASGSALTFDGVVASFQKRARALPISNSGDPGSGPRVCTINRHYVHTVDNRTSPAAMSELFRQLVNDDTVEALVAGGGWCAPSENLYNFFNATCVDGLIDLPTVGVSRGGIRWPQARSLATIINTAFVFGNTTNPWLWTEADDTMTVTGTPNKPCVRVPCPDFDERRLECYGICLTAGNLTDDAFPESTADYLRILLAAHQHAMNARTIAWMIAQSIGPFAGGDYAVADIPVTNQILGGTALAAADYRTRLGLCDRDPLELVMPMWLRDMIRADLAWRQGVDYLSVGDAEIDRMFQVRRLAPQWVGDWQVRAAGQIGASPGFPIMGWPDQVDFMLYAPGTFVRGNGLTLDLGVVRDSVLNAENDHTAAWSEECHLVARIGPESRVYRTEISVRGLYENTPVAFADRL